MKIEEMRGKWVKEELPRFMGYFEKQLGSNPFLCGTAVTIADLWALPQFRYFTRGVADHVPKECMDGFGVVQAWMARMLEIPEIKAWYKL